MTNEHTQTLLNKKVLTFQGNWRYKGIVLIDAPDFITLLDERTGRRVMLNRSSITTLEILE